MLRQFEQCIPRCRENFISSIAFQYYQTVKLQGKGYKTPDVILNNLNLEK